MNRKQADIAVGLLLALIVLLGIVSAVQLQLTGMPMSGQMESVPVIAAFGPALMSLVFVSIIGGVYVYVRSSVFTTSESEGGEESSSTEPKDTADSEIGGNSNTQPSKSETNSQILAVLPEDEQRILEPVIESPGLTQIKVKDRSGFSRSKVSQTVSDLEERGLLYRESQGRTYRIYPADDLHDRI